MNDSIKPVVIDKEAEQELLGEDNFRHLAEAIPEIVWTANPNGELDYISPQYSEYTGMSQDDPEYLDWLSFIHPDDRQATEDEWRICAQEGKVYEAEFRLREAGGGHLWFSARAVPVLGHGGKILKWYGTSINIESQKQVEQTLQKAAEDKDKFIAMLGHELRNPLAAISTSYHTLSHPEMTESQREKSLDVLGKQIAHLTRLVDDTLDISRLSSGKLRLVTSKLELNQLAEECLEAFTKSAEENELVTLLHTADQPVWVEGDGIRLSQCLSNLLNNAIKFTDPGGKIMVSIVSDEAAGCARIIVEDTGVGISESEIPNVFDPFRQGDSAQQLSKDGLGLGLAVIRDISRLHGGDVTATSGGPGEGALFTISIPLSEAPVLTDEATESEEPVAAGVKKILVVEDNPSVAASLELFLELEGHDVTIAEDGEKALEILGQKIPDLVFCDLTLPGSLKGWDVARHARMNIPEDQIPFLVALSGHAQDHHVDRSIEAGFDIHIAKPPSPEQLRDALILGTARS